MSQKPFLFTCLKSRARLSEKVFLTEIMKGLDLKQFLKSGKSTLKFSFVRNPYDRLISAWKMFTKGMENSVWKTPDNLDGNLSLVAFIKIAMDESISYHDRSTLEGKLRHHAIPQTHPYNCLKEADFVGHFENLEEDFGKVCETLHIPYTGLPHWNITDHSDYRSYYDEESKALADKFLKEDIETLGYSF